MKDSFVLDLDKRCWIQVNVAGERLRAGVCFGSLSQSTSFYLYSHLQKYASSCFEKKDKKNKDKNTRIGTGIREKTK